MNIQILMLEFIQIHIEIAFKIVTLWFSPNYIHRQIQTEHLYKLWQHKPTNKNNDFHDAPDIFRYYGFSSVNATAYSKRDYPRNPISKHVSNICRSSSFVVSPPRYFHFIL